MLHPHGRVSDVQRRQMTTVLAPNVHNIAIEGSFDDAQAMVKRMFNDAAMTDRFAIGAVNSINWARLMAQVVYYFWAALQLGAPERKVAFSVPTGNFGDIFAGYLAHRMGLPVAQLIIATNANDILHRCISANDYRRESLVHTLSPSMDIMISSNFERLLFDLYERDGAAVAALMAGFEAGETHLDPVALARARELFSSHRLDDDATVATIRAEYQASEYLLDPHSAIGVAAARRCRRDAETPVICLATAHPAKFPEAVQRAGYPGAPPLPGHLADLFARAERCAVLGNDLDALRRHIAANLSA